MAKVMTHAIKLAKEALELAGKATPGPWKAELDWCDCSEGSCSHGQFPHAIHTPDHQPWTMGSEEPECDPNEPGDYYHHARTELAEFTVDDAEFIAFARNNIETLARAVLKLTEERNEARAIAEKFRDDYIADVRPLVAKLAEALKRIVELERQLPSQEQVASKEYAQYARHRSEKAYEEERKRRDQ